MGGPRAQGDWLARAGQRSTGPDASLLAHSTVMGCRSACPLPHRGLHMFPAPQMRAPPSPPSLAGSQQEREGLWAPDSPS